MGVGRDSQHSYFVSVCQVILIEDLSLTLILAVGRASELCRENDEHPLIHTVLGNPRLHPQGTRTGKPLTKLSLAQGN